MTRHVTFSVPGTPEPKGSTRIVPVKGRARITSANPKLKSWQRAIAWTARALAAPLLAGPVDVVITFRLTRPRSLPRRIVHPERKPDLDKLTRAVFDALTGVVLRDDAQIVAVHACKCFVIGDGAPGVEITIVESEPPFVVDASRIAAEPEP